jgi:hypothetical protein
MVQETATQACIFTGTNDFLLRLVSYFRKGFSSIKNISQVALRLGWSPWHASRITFKHILNTPSSEQGAIIDHFIANKQRELDTVAVAVSLSPASVLVHKFRVD